MVGYAELLLELMPVAMTVAFFVWFFWIITKGFHRAAAFTTPQATLKVLLDLRIRSESQRQRCLPGVRNAI
jgi:hypothetical protein